PAGPINRLLLGGQKTEAQARLAELADIFDKRLYVELQRHGLREEEVTEPDLIDFAYTQGLPLVATNEPYFADADAFEAHDALICIAESTYVMEADRRRLSPEHRFKSSAEMASLFADLPEALETTIEIAKRCAFRPTPRAPILPRFGAEHNLDEAAELR